MIFNDPEIDEPIRSHHISQLVFLSKQGAELGKKAFIKQGFDDITELFCDATDTTPLITAALNQQDCLFDLNLFYTYWIEYKRLEYIDATWRAYFLLKKVLPQNPTSKLIIIGYKRSMAYYKKYGGNIYDTLLFSDFLDLFIYPIYQEFSFFAQDTESFNQYVSYLQSTHEVPDKYNFSVIQYMKLSGKSIVKLEY